MVAYDRSTKICNASSKISHTRQKQKKHSKCFYYFRLQKEAFATRSGKRSFLQRAVENTASKKLNQLQH